MIDKINRIKEEAAAATAATAQEVEDLRIKFLSKKGVVSSLMADFRNVPAESKRELGQKLNELKTFVTEKINSLKEGLSANADEEAAAVDLTRTETLLLRLTPSAFNREERYYPHFRGNGFHDCRRSGD